MVSGHGRKEEKQVVVKLVFGELWFVCCLYNTAAWFQGSVFPFLAPRALTYT